MTYELIQSALTALINVTAIAGFSAIALHALYTQHKNFMTEFCPPVTPYKAEVQAEEAPAAEPQPEQPVIEDAWEAPISSSPARYWVRPTEVSKPALILCPAKEEKRPTKKSRKAPAKPKAPATPRSRRKSA